MAIAELYKRIACSRLARRHGMEAQFTTGQLAAMIKRVQEDPIFAERHEGLAARALAATRAIGVERAARTLPAWLDSPMLVQLRFRGGRDTSRSRAVRVGEEKHCHSA